MRPGKCRRGLTRASPTLAPPPAGSVVSAEVRGVDPREARELRALSRRARRMRSRNSLSLSSAYRISKARPLSSPSELWISSTVSSNPRASSPDDAMLNSRAAKAIWGWLLAIVSARADEAGRVEDARVCTVEAAKDCAVSVAEGAEDCTVSDAELEVTSEDEIVCGVAISARSFFRSVI